MIVSILEPDSYPGKFCSRRLFEWFATVAMLGSGLAMLASDMAGAPVAASGLFLLLREAKLPIDLMAWCMIVIGSTRVVVLILNGRLANGPMFRSIGALAGAMIWGQFALAMTAAVFATPHRIFIGLPIYLPLMLGELVSCYRAAFEAGKRQRDGDGGVQ